jgi:predicted metalloprotease with PDZ domain
MLPLLNQRYRWISEGFATYYQNVLMSRAGRYTPELAWLRLSEGFERGRESRPELSPNDAAAGGIRQARMKVYWSGAAIALLADIELRTRSGADESLDQVLGQLQACCLPSRRRWSGPRLFEKLDSFVSTPVFMPLYEEYADQDGFPDMSAVLDELGVSVDENGVTFRGNSSLAEIREAISAPAIPSSTNP